MKTTIADRLIKVEDMRNRYVMNAEEDMAEYLTRAKKDYCAFFHWNAGNAYKAQMVYDYFSNMTPISTNNDIDILRKNLNYRIKLIENHLISTPAFGSCTDEIVNLEHRLKLSGSQSIREKLLEMLWIIEFER